MEGVVKVKVLGSGSVSAARPDAPSPAHVRLAEERGSHKCMRVEAPQSGVLHQARCELFAVEPV